MKNTKELAKALESINNHALLGKEFSELLNKQSLYTIKDKFINKLLFNNDIAIKDCVIVNGYYMYLFEINGYETFGFKSAFPQIDFTQFEAQVLKRVEVKAKAEENVMPLGKALNVYAEYCSDPHRFINKNIKLIDEAIALRDILISIDEEIILNGEKFEKTCLIRDFIGDKEYTMYPINKQYIVEFFAVKKSFEEIKAELNFLKSKSNGEFKYLSVLRITLLDLDKLHKTLRRFIEKVADILTVFANHGVWTPETDETTK